MMNAATEGREIENPVADRTMSLDPSEWLDAFGDRLFRYALARVSCRAEAEDLVQETFLAAISARDRYRGEAAVETWLISILRRKIVDHYRASRSDSSEDQKPTFAVESPFDEHGFWKVQPSHWKSPPDELTLQEFLRSLDACLTQLPTALAEVFERREIGGEDPAAISRSLGISKGNLRVRLHRARLLLRACIERKTMSTKP